VVEFATRMGRTTKAKANPSKKESKAAPVHETPQAPPQVHVSTRNEIVAENEKLLKAKLSENVVS
jgi:hypothetical protein